MKLSIVAQLLSRLVGLLPFQQGLRVFQHQRAVVRVDFFRLRENAKGLVVISLFRLNGGGDQQVGDVFLVFRQQRAAMFPRFLVVLRRCQRDCQPVPVHFRQLLSLRFRQLVGEKPDRDRRVFLRQHHQFRLDQVETFALVIAAQDREGGGPRFGIGDAAGGQRVGAQELRRLDGVAGVSFQLPEKIRHSPRIEPGTGQQLYADSVRLLLVGTGEVDLLLGGGALHGEDGRLPGVGVLRGHQNGAQHGRQPGNAHFFGHLHGARHVFLRDMGDFMGHDPGQLAFGVRVQDNAAIQSHNAAGRGKGVDLGVVDDEEGELLGVVVALGHQAVAYGLYVGFHLRIADDVRLLPDLA